jgi:hypothetical protein
MAVIELGWNRTSCMFYLRTICPHYIHSIVSVAVMYVYEVELDEDCLGGGNGASFRASANKVSICFSFSVLLANLMLARLSPSRTSLALDLP